MRKIDEIILHCSATPEGRDVSTEQIRKMHKAPVSAGGRGWKDIGYHYVIELDGSVHVGRKEETIGAHCSGRNAHSIGVCYVGGVAKDGKKAKDTRNVAQYNAMTQLLKDLVKRYPGVTIHGHYEYANKACPSFNVPSYLRSIGLALMAIILLVVIPGCASKKTVSTNHTTLDQHQTTEENSGLKSETDSAAHALTIHETDSLDSTNVVHSNIIYEFTFVAGGGSYNTKTGEANGVAGAKLQANIDELNRTVREKDTRIEQLSTELHAARDTISNLRSELASHLTKDEQVAPAPKPSKPFGWKFCVWSTAILWLLVLYNIIRWLIKLYLKYKP